MLIKRELIKVKTPESQPGYLGAGHIARPVMMNKFSETDPFILLMDDVATTGSTISACTDALLSAGAQEIYALTIARALSHHDLTRV